MPRKTNSDAATQLADGSTASAVTAAMNSEIEHVTPPSIEMPLDDGPLESTSEEFTSRNTQLSALRLMLLIASLLIVLPGAIYALLSTDRLVPALITGFSLITWWLIAWKIRNRALSSKSQQLDISLNEARETAEKANLAKTRFLAMASHEMRTPLNGILGMAKLLDETNLTPQQANYNTAIKSSGNALYSFAEDMLDITRIEIGHFELNPEPADISHELEQLCELLATRAHEKDLEIAALSDAAVPQLVQVDIRRLRQVLTNLASNAIKFTASGGLTIEAELNNTNPATPMIRFIVSDTGPGIVAEDRQRIFEEFEQADIDTTRKFGGAGLGLSISKAIVEKMNGTLSVEENDKQGGARFIAQIPLVVASGTSPVSRNIPQSLKGKRIILVSKRNIEANIIARMIDQSGGVAHLVDSLEDAIKEVELHEDIAVIVDQPLLAENKTIAAKIAQNFSLIVLLQPTRQIDMAQYHTLGVSSFLIKPVRRQSLLAVLTGDTDLADSSVHNEIARAPATNDVILANRSDATKILLAEDNEVNSLLVRSILEKDGHQVCLASNGAIAVEMFEHALNTGQPFYLIYMDLHMPVMDGLSAMRKIRDIENHGNIQKTRMVALSADEQQQTRTDARQAGADGFLAKPFDPATLLSETRKKLPR